MDFLYNIFDISEIYNFKVISIVLVVSIIIYIFLAVTFFKVIPKIISRGKKTYVSSAHRLIIFIFILVISVLGRESFIAFTKAVPAQKLVSTSIKNTYIYHTGGYSSNYLINDNLIPLKIQVDIDDNQYNIPLPDVELYIHANNQKIKISNKSQFRHNSIYDEINKQQINVQYSIQNLPEVLRKNFSPALIKNCTQSKDCYINVYIIKKRQDLFSLGYIDDDNEFLVNFIGYKANKVDQLDALFTTLYALYLFWLIVIIFLSIAGAIDPENGAKQNEGIRRKLTPIFLRKKTQSISISSKLATRIDEEEKDAKIKSKIISVGLLFFLFLIISFSYILFSSIFNGKEILLIKNEKFIHLVSSGPAKISSQYWDDIDNAYKSQNLYTIPPSTLKVNGNYLKTNIKTIYLDLDCKNYKNFEDIPKRDKDYVFSQTMRGKDLKNFTVCFLPKDKAYKVYASQKNNSIDIESIGMETSSNSDLKSESFSLILASVITLIVSLVFFWLCILAAKQNNVKFKDSLFIALKFAYIPFMFYLPSLIFYKILIPIVS